MVQDQETLGCLKCGYALQGLPARKCGDCGHVYLRCPECGASQIANEAQNRMLLQMRARAVRLPGRVQTLQIAFLVVLGVGWVMAGFIGVAASKEVTLGGYLAFAAVAMFCACFVRLLVFRLRNGLLAAGGTLAFVAGAAGVGIVFGWGVTNARGNDLLALALSIATGAALGAAGAVVLGWLMLWLFAKDADRAVLTEGYRSAQRGRLFGGAEIRETRHLMYCTHCAAELPALVPGTCTECGLRQVTCPACEKHCGVSDALAGMVSLGKVTRSISAGVWVIVRMAGAVAMWQFLLVGLHELLSPYSPAVTGPVAGFIWVPTNPVGTAMLMLLVAVTTWFVFVRGALAAAVLSAAMVWTAGWCLMETYREYLVNAMPLQSAIVVVTVGAAVASLVASGLAAFVRAALPKRRVEMLEEVVPELAREQAKT